MSRSEIKEAVIAGAVLATSLAVRDSIYSLVKKYIPLPADEFYANLLTTLITILLLFVVLLLSRAYMTSEELSEKRRKQEKILRDKLLVDIAKSSNFCKIANMP